MGVDLNSLSDQELEALSKGDLNSLSDKALSVISSAQSQPKEPTIMNKVFDIPGAAVRSAIQGTGYAQGAMNYENVPKFQDQAIQGANDAMTKLGIDKLPQPVNEAARFMGGIVPSAVGMAADVATNPADILGIVAGHGAEKALADTAVGQAIHNVMNKEFRLVKFGGNEALRDAAVKAKSALGVLDSHFANQYDQLFSQIGGNATSSAPLHSAIVNSIDKTFSGSPTEKFLTKIMDNNPSDISANDLHAIRQEIASKIPNNVLSGRMKPDAEQSALMDVYKKAQDMLSQPNMGGDAYKAITNQYADYMKNVNGYVRKLILDNMGNVTEKNLQNYSRQPQNVKDAMQTLQETIAQRGAFSPSTPGAGQDIIPDVNAINRQRFILNKVGKLATNPITYAVTGGAYGLKKLLHSLAGQE